MILADFRNHEQAIPQLACEKLVQAAPLHLHRTAAAISGDTRHQFSPRGPLVAVRPYTSARRRSSFGIPVRSPLDYVNI